MKGIIKFFIQHPTLVNLFVYLLVGIGVLKLYQTQSTNFPSQKVRFIDISIPYIGASPSEVESGVVVKVEDNLEGIDGIDRVTSESRQNLGIIEVELEEYAEANQLLVEVKNAVDQINDFPEGVEPASVVKREPKDLTVAFGITGELPLQLMKDYAEEIREDLMAIDGISQIFINGLPQEEIEISVRENDLRTYNLSILDIQSAIQNANLETFGGDIETGNQVINIKADEKSFYAKEIKNTIIKADAEGNVVYLQDVADVVDQFKDEANARLYQGKRIATVEVYTLNSEDILKNAEAAKAYIEDFNKSYEGIDLVILEDGTINLKSRLSTMIDSGIVGIILVLVVLALFLDRYLAWWVALKIPIAIVGMFVMVDVYGMTINVVSLFGFILVLGILVDDGIVIGENIYRHAKELGKPPLKAALDGTVEMVVPVIIAISTTAVAFSMFFFLPTQAGEFFGEVGFVVIAVLIVAILESFFVLPVHLSHSRGLKGDVKLTKIEKAATNLIAFLRDKLYMPSFKNVIVGKGLLTSLTLVVFVTLLIGSITLVPTGIVSFTFFPNIDDDAIFIELELPPGTPKELTQERLAQIEAATWQVNEDYSIVRKDDKEVVRFAEQIVGPLDNQGKLKVTFLNGEERGVSSFDLSKSIRDASPSIPEATRLIFGLGATSSLFGLPVSFSLRGEDLDELRKAKEELKEGMIKHPDVKDVSDNDMQGIKELHISLKPKGELLGLTLSSVMAQVRAGFFGVEAQSLQRGDNEVEIWVRYTEEERSSIDNLMNMQIRTPKGNFYLKDIAEVEQQTGTLTINHTEGVREITIEANVANINVSAPKAIAYIEQTILPGILERYESVSYTVEGQNRMSFKLIGAISTVGPIILLFVFALIVINCNSFSQALMVFLLFPFALIGVIFGHWVHATPLSIFSLIGTIALIGVFVNDTLVLLSTMNDYLKEGESFSESLLKTARTRFRPVLITSITTIAGLAPLIFSSSLSAQFLKGPAIAIAYGMGFGLFNVLLLLPIFLIVFNRMRRAWFYRFSNKDYSTEEVEPAIRKMKYLIKD
ncbi:MAG: efflux RND transporter permease subunit [Bacteroidota bacterium]